MNTRSSVSEKPFRWNLEREEQLGRLLDQAELQELGPRDYQDMAQCCSRIIAHAGNSRLPS